MKDILSEALVTFGGQAYPKFGQVVILAGGGGSYVDSMTSIKVKSQDMPQLSPDVVIADDIARKIHKYTPKTRSNPWQNIG